MQKLNLSSLKKQRVDSSTIQTGSNPDIVVSPENISSTPLSIANQVQPAPISTQEVLNEQTMSTSEVVEPEISEKVSVVSANANSQEVPAQSIATREFFPNLRVEFNLLDDLTGPKNQDMTSSSSVVSNAESKPEFMNDAITIVNDDIIEEIVEVQEIPLSNSSSLIDDVQVTEVTPEFNETVVQEVSKFSPSSESVSLPSTPVVSLTSVNPEEVAKELSAQRTGGLGILTGKKKFVFAGSGLLVMLVAGFVVFNFLPTQEIKTSVGEGTVVVQNTINPDIANNPAETPIAPVETTDNTSSTGAEVSTQSGSLTGTGTDTKASSTGEIVTTSTGGLIEGTGATIETSGTGVVALNGTGSVVETQSGSLTGTGTDTKASSTGSVTVKPTTEEELSAFTGTRVINFRTPNIPRQKK